GRLGGDLRIAQRRDLEVVDGKSRRADAAQRVQAAAQEARLGRARRRTAGGRRRRGDSLPRPFERESDQERHPRGGQLRRGEIAVGDHGIDRQARGDVGNRNCTRERTMRTRIAGTGRALPSKVLTNDDLSKMVATSDEWIAERTGIRERRILEEGRSTSDLCAEAAKSALKAAEIDPKEIDCIIVGTISPDMPMP